MDKNEFEGFLLILFLAIPFLIYGYIAVKDKREYEKKQKKS